MRQTIGFRLAFAALVVASIVRDPDNLFVVLIESPPPAT
jgi:hypothetical protein